MIIKDFETCKLITFKDYNKLEIVKQKYQDILILLILLIFVIIYKVS